MEESMSIALRYNELNGKKIAYHNCTEFVVQTGKGKGSYKTRCRFTGDLGQAVFNYNCINIHSGFKKRLLMLGANKPVLARQISR